MNIKLLPLILVACLYSPHSEKNWDECGVTDSDDKDTEDYIEPIDTSV
jgi:antirestriction protein